MTRLFTPPLSLQATAIALLLLSVSGSIQADPVAAQGADSTRAPAVLGGAATDVRGPLRLEDALRLALAASPTLAERQWMSRADLARARDEAMRPNPTLDFTLENFGGGLGSGRQERTASLSQPIGLGGRRGALARVAREVDRRGQLDLEAVRREVVQATGEAFLEAWWQERRVRHLRRTEAIGAAAIDAARERTRIGAAPATERLRAESDWAQREIERRNAEAELASARASLALTWGAPQAAFDSLVLAPPADSTLGDPATLGARLGDHPEVRRAAAETAVAAARLSAARASRLPQVDVLGGARYLKEVDATGFLIGLSAPIPVWNRGGALVQAADADYRAAQARERTVRIGLERELAGAYEHLRASFRAYEIARTRALPAARQALAQVGSGYRAGRFSFLDYSEAQRSASEIELAALQAVHDYWSARLSLSRLTGVPAVPGAGEEMR